MSTTAVATVQDRPKVQVDVQKPVLDPNTLRRVIGTQFKTLGAVMPAHMTEERFAALVISAASKTPDLFKCTGISILNAMYQAASLGLEINAATGEAYLIPYGKTAQLVPGYKGLVKLAIQHQEVRAIEARLVYAGEEETFKVEYGTDSRIEHRPNFDIERTPDTVIRAYAVAKMASGTPTFEVMTRKQLDAIRARSAAANSGPWKSDTEEMFRKTVTRRLCKYLPMSPQLADAIELSDRAETGDYDGARDRRTAGAEDLNAALNSAPAAQTDEEIRAEEQRMLEREEAARAGKAS